MARKRVTARAVATATVLTLVGALPAGPAAGATNATASAANAEYTVVAEDGVAAATAIDAITAAGGTIVSRNDSVGVYRVISTRADFARQATESAALIAAAPRRPIGWAPGDRKPDEIETEPASSGTTSATATGGPATADPLDEKLWGLRMIEADRARAKEPGKRGVTVGVLDTGLDASQPDLAPNFSAALSRNFAPDMIDIDGECEVESCLDPVGTDDDGHGTHVAGTIGAAVNGFGLSGVAPNVTLVELKGGQDSGYFFLEPVINALTYAGQAGLDVVNMSFYVDPWLYNCLNNPADSPEAQAQQRAIIVAMKRALNYAHNRGVTLIGSLGNNAEDLGNPRPDTSSPDYGGDPYERQIDNKTCWDLPVEGPHVIGVSAVGPSTRKADYSNYGLEQIEVSAPGGFRRDGFGTDTFNSYSNAILSTYPKKVLQADGLVDADGNVTPAGQGIAFKECAADGQCGYYRYLQGTSMASPHVTGVSALIVSKFGIRDRHRGGLMLAPWKVRRQLLNTAAEHACPEPRLVTYTNEGRPVEWNAYCAGGVQFNGFYGHGIINAYQAVTRPLG